MTTASSTVMVAPAISMIPVTPVGVTAVTWWVVVVVILGWVAIPSDSNSSNTSRSAADSDSRRSARDSLDS